MAKEEPLITRKGVEQGGPPIARSKSEGDLSVSSQHFIEQHREELIKWTNNVEAILDMLFGIALNEEQFQRISTKRTNPEKMQELFKMVPTWSPVFKDKMYKALKIENKSLIDNLEGLTGELHLDNFRSAISIGCPNQMILTPKILANLVCDSQEGHKTYRLHFTGPCSFHCSYTDLIFEVRATVTLTYHFDSWSKYLDEWKTEQWMIAGPLLNIKADTEEAVAAIHFPHFLHLAGEDSSQVYIAHFVEGGMSLERPDSVKLSHAVLENPHFSPRGVIFKKSWFGKTVQVYAVAQLYQAHEVPTTKEADVPAAKEPEVSTAKFHLYLLPNDPSLTEAVNKHELNGGSQKVEKPPATIKPLTLGSRFFVQRLNNVRICPKELEFTYLHAEMKQQYLELYARHMQDELVLKLMEKNKDEIVWEAYVGRGDLNSFSLHAIQGASNQIQSSAPSTSATLGRSERPVSVSPQHFIEQHREELIMWTSNVEGILDRLYDIVLNEEQYQRILSGRTSQDKMRELYKLVPSWDHICKDKLYEALKIKNKFLIDKFEGR